MSGQRAAAEPYTTSWETTVRDVDGREVRLDTTYFYAEAGGQPADRGTVDGVPVVDVQTVAGETVHTLAEPLAFEAGATVSGAVDREFRTYCMRAHTASHALYGAGRRILDDVGYGGFDIAPPDVDGGDVDGGKVRIDFTTSTDVGRAELVELEELVNRVVWESREVTWESMSQAEARALDDIAFNEKTEEGVLSDADSVRVVTIGDRDGDDRTWDVAACGGTHVRNTREIGPVTVLDRSNPGEGLTRVEFVVGPPGIRRRAAEKTALLGAGETLGTPPTEVGTDVERLVAERDDLRDEVANLQRDLVDATLATATPVERDGRRWVVETVEGVGPNDVRGAVSEAVGAVADVVVLVGEDGNTFVVAGSAGDPPAGDVVDEVTGEFGGGGGGSDAFAQGGGLGGAPADVVAYLTE